MAGKRKPKAKELAQELAPALAVPEKVQRPEFNGGTLYAGGVPGHRGGGGRPPDEFKALLAVLATRTKTIGALARILRNESHPLFVAAFKHVQSRAYPELEPVIIAAKLRASASNSPAPVGGLTINFNFIQEGPRFVEVEASAEPNGNGNGHE